MHLKKLSSAFPIVFTSVWLGCSGAAELVPSEVSPVTAEETNTANTDDYAQLAALADDVASAALSEGAAIQMLLLREQVYLPFRYSADLSLDGRGLAAGRGLELVGGFERIGGAGQSVLADCVREGAHEQTGRIHLRGDDEALLGRACLRMMADAYGVDALPFLIAFGGEEAATPSMVLLQRAALDVIDGLAPSEAVVSAAASWREALEGWAAWYKGESNLALAPPDMDCDSVCEDELLGEWMALAAAHQRMSAGQGEPRLVRTLRAYLDARAERWLPHLSDRVKTAMTYRDSSSPLASGLMLDLWAQTAERRYPRYFRTTVLPTLALSIEPREADLGTEIRLSTGEVVRRRPYRLTHSQMVVRALERATGVAPELRACTRPDAEDAGLRRCLFAQALFWRRFADQTSWPI